MKIRRKIASKVIGKKLIQGYSLRGTPCTKCIMPLMENPDTSELECVVCPVLVKKVQKKMADRKVAEKKKKGEEHAQQLKLEMKHKTEQILKEEQGFLPEVQATRKTATDEEEQRIMDEIKKARERRIEVENKPRQLRVDDDNRYRVIEDLRNTREEEQSPDMKHQTEEKAPAEEKSSDDKILEYIHEEECKELIEDLRVAREQTEIEAKLRIEEAKEATEMQKQSERRLALKEKEHDEMQRRFERLLALKEKEHEDNMAQFKKAQALMMEGAKRCEQDLRKAEVRAKEAEEQLAEIGRRRKCARENVSTTSAILCMPWLS